MRTSTTQVSGTWGGGLSTLVGEGTAEVEKEALEVKAGLERWFDETMSRAEGAYKRWATVILFLVGLLIAAAYNVPAARVAQSMWSDPAVRQIVVEAADRLDETDAKTIQDQQAIDATAAQLAEDARSGEVDSEEVETVAEDMEDVADELGLKSVARAADELKELSLPIGWATGGRRTDRRSGPLTWLGSS